MKVFQTIAGHNERVSALAWNGNCLSSGSKDTYIHHHDLRDPKIVKTLSGHTKEVCGLKWSFDGK
jgi:WD40 repeat protein